MVSPTVIIQIPVPNKNKRTKKGGIYHHHVVVVDDDDDDDDDRRRQNVRLTVGKGSMTLNFAQFTQGWPL